MGDANPSTTMKGAPSVLREHAQRVCSLRSDRAPLERRCSLSGGTGSGCTGGAGFAGKRGHTDCRRCASGPPQDCSKMSHARRPSSLTPLGIYAMHSSKRAHGRTGHMAEQRSERVASIDESNLVADFPRSVPNAAAWDASTPEKRPWQGPWHRRRLTATFEPR